MASTRTRSLRRGLTTAPAPAPSAAQRVAAAVAAGFGLSLCPRCRLNVTQPANGHDTLCERCTVRELGLSVAENARRIELGWTLRRWLAHDDPMGVLPGQSSAFRRRTH